MGKSVERKSGWLSLYLAIPSLIIIGYIRWQFVFVCGNCVQLWLLIAMALALMSMILGFRSLATWPGKIAIALTVVLHYILLFSPLYALA